MALFRPALSLLVLLSALTGLAYPLLVTAAARVLFPAAAAGSLVVRDGAPAGSSLIGQPFDDPRYLWGRLSATAPFPYNAGASSGSNLGPLNPALEAAVAALRPAGSEEPALLAGAIDRAFDGDLDRFARFMAALQAGVPAGTRLVLRGSSVQGSSYKTGEPFDARGPGTSDLDIVLIGDEAMAAWAPEAFYLPGVNTHPLYDEARDIASPTLEEARAAAQAVAGRPVALQAMTRWFLDLRSGLQGTPYVVLGG